MHAAVPYSTLGQLNARDQNISSAYGSHKPSRPQRIERSRAGRRHRGRFAIFLPISRTFSAVRASKRSLPLDRLAPSRAWRPSPVGWRKRPVPNSSADRSRLLAPQSPKVQKVTAPALRRVRSMSRPLFLAGNRVVSYSYFTRRGKRTYDKQRPTFCHCAGRLALLASFSRHELLPFFPPFLLVLHTYSVLVQSSAVIDQLFLRDDGG
jgi:hypothetical protein